MYNKYIVQEGDTIETIALKFNITPKELLELNNYLYRENFTEGMEILIPAQQEDFFNVYTINEGDNLYQIGKKYNINPILLCALNGMEENDYIYPNQKILIPKNDYTYYITTDGDTIDLVASQFNIEPQKLLENNTIYLLPGQLIVHKK